MPALSTNQNCTTDVLNKLDKINHKVAKKQYLGANNGNVIPKPYYTKPKGYQLGPPPGKTKNHFQGVQRCGKFLLISAGLEPKTQVKSQAQLILIEMGSQKATGPWSMPSYQPNTPKTRLYNHRYPHPLDQVQAVFDLDKTLWHGGGIQMMGTTLAMPVANSAKKRVSEIRFYDLADVFKALRSPDKYTPSQLQKELKLSTKLPTIKREGTAAYAVALAQNPKTKNIMTIVWNDKTLDFYTLKPGTKQWSKPKSVKGKDIRGFDHPLPQKQYQCINLIADTEKNVMYLVAFHNTLASDPVVGDGKDYADFFAFSTDFDPDKPLVSGDPAVEKQAFVKVGKKKLQCKDDQANLNAAGGTYLTSQGDIYFYATPLWLNKDNAVLNFNEYIPV